MYMYVHNTGEREGKEEEEGGGGGGEGDKNSEQDLY